MNRQAFKTESEEISCRQQAGIRLSLKSFGRLGVEFTTTSVYTPLTNGIAERINRTPLDKAPAMLAEAGMNEMFWREAKWHAAYLHNRTVTPTLETKTRQEALLSNTPNNSKLRIFGSAACAFRCKEKRVGKFRKKAEVGVYLSSREGSSRTCMPSSRTVTTTK